MMTIDELKAIEARVARDVSEDSPAQNDHERLTRAVYAQCDRAELLGEVKRLRGHLERLVAEENTNSHGHARRGTWDASNGPPDGGRPCARCHAFADAREALGLSRWQEVPRGEDGAVECPRACGCGGRGGGRG